MPGPGLGSRDRLAPWGGERGQVRKGSAEAPGNLPKESIQGPGPRKGSTLRPSDTREWMRGRDSNRKEYTSGLTLDADPQNIPELLE